MIDCSNGRLDEMKAFAARTNQTEQLENVLARLCMREENGRGIKVTIFEDFAPLSLYFVAKYPNGEFAGNGGVIYHGPHDNGGDGSAPTFSVNLTPHTGWSIHT
jgi:hypothetical protein